MKPLSRILGLTFLALTLTNCSGQLSSEKIASRLDKSIVRLFYRNQTGHGTGFFVPGEKGVCSVLTAAHVVKREGENLLQTQDRKVWKVGKVEIFPGDLDLALVTFEPEGEYCNYPALKIGNSESLNRGSSIYISGFPTRSGKLVPQFVSGTVSGLDRLAQGYGISYQALTVGGMSGAPVVDVRGKVVAVHGRSDVEIVESFASLQASLSPEERETFQQAMARVNGIQRLTFSWGVPINVFQEYRGRAIALGGEKQEVELQSLRGTKEYNSEVSRAFGDKNGGQKRTKEGGGRMWWRVLEVYWMICYMLGGVILFGLGVFFVGFGLCLPFCKDIIRMDEGGIWNLLELVVAGFGYSGLGVGIMWCSRFLFLWGWVFF